MRKFLVLFGGLLFFVSNSFSQTTVEMVKDINPTGDSNPKEFMKLNGKLYFSADDGSNGRELWVSDGTSGGTTMVKNINPSGDSNPVRFIELNGKIYFQADNGFNGKELWVTDGTATGTTMVKNINPSGDGNAYPFLKLNNKIYFSADDGVNGQQGVICKRWYNSWNTKDIPCHFP